jgi:hypothetical protein
LIERIERYQRSHNISTLDDAIERLVRIGLFTEAAPTGSQLARRGESVTWSAPDEPRPSAPIALASERELPDEDIGF